jgi:uncharacterized cupredoxin-like copper-binding protein
MRRLCVPTSLALVLVLALQACSFSSAPSTSLHVTLTDFSFSPNVFTVPANQQISVELSNNGAVAHSFLIMKAGQKAQGHFVDTDKAGVYWSVDVIPPGETKQATFTSPNQVGEYQIVCDVAGHLEAGMVAKLVVVAQP